MDKNIVAIVQARMASSRLPGKVLEDLGHLPVLGWVLRRARRANLIDRVVVATTTDPSDDPVAEYCLAEGIAMTRGSMHDVLDRYYQSAKHFKADVIVRLTGDCPLIDPAMLDSNLAEFLTADPPLDFAANRLPPPYKRTVPIGLDAEYCTFEALEYAWKVADEKHHREHVMPYFYEHPEIFSIRHIIHEPDYGNYRWTVDTLEDLEALRAIIAHFPGRDDFSWREVLQLVQEHPELLTINTDVQHKDYREVDKRHD